MPPIFLLTGFSPFRGERVNPSWEVARLFDGETIGGLQIKSVRVPVNCAAAARRVTAAVVRYRPRAVLGLGEAGGRPTLSLERIAINLAVERPRTRGGRNRGRAETAAVTKAVIRDGPDAYFSRLPLEAIQRELSRAADAGVSQRGVSHCNPSFLWCESRSTGLSNRKSAAMSSMLM